MLTTRCPHCQTMFRIRPEQLSMRGGRVRCGSCHQAFSALASLEELPDDLPEERQEGRGEDQAAASPPPQKAGVKETPPAPPEPAAAPAPAPAAASQVASPASKAEPAPQAPEAPLIMPSAEPAANQVREAPIPDTRPEPKFSGDVPAEFDEDFELPDPPVFATDKPSEAADALELTWVAIDHPALTNGALQPSPERVEDIAGERFTLPGDVEEPFAARPADKARIDHPLPDAATLDFIEPAVAGPVAPKAKDKVKPVAAAPYRSKIAEELGINPYDPAKDHGSGFTVLLEDTVDDSSAVAAASLDDDYGADEAARHPAQRKKALLPWIGGSLLLATLAALQAGFVFRTDLARTVPAVRPVLEDFCQHVGCRVPYPRDADLIQVDSTSLNPEGGPGRFRLTVNLHNKANYAQAWPHLELTLTDRFDIAIVRRVLKPNEWLPQASATQPAFPGRDDVTANVIVEADGLPAVGYRVYAFYP